MSKLEIIGENIGQGGFGSVFLAKWESRWVAVKKFRVTRNDLEANKAILKEIKMLQSLRDQHVIQFYGYADHEDQLVLIMEYARGGSLDQVIKNRALDWSDKIRIAKEIARGLAFIHHRCIIHCDLKSMNVLLTGQMEAKLSDFGLATVKETSATNSNSNVTHRGTLRWFAPELCEVIPKYSKKSDVYALGMVMWEMAASCVQPFSHQLDMGALMALIQNGAREELPPDTPLDYRRWVEQCWKQDPSKRPEAKELVATDDVPHETKYLDMSFSGQSSMAVVRPPNPGPGPSMGGRPSSSSRVPISWQSKTLVDNFSPHLVEAERGTLEAQMAQAAMYEESKNYLGAFKWYLQAADQGHAPAQHKVGEFYYNGRCMPVDTNEALMWFLLAASQGNKEAYSSLGDLYMSGRHVEKNYAEALEWYRKAADQGCARGQCGLGYMYQHGYGVKRNYGEAWLWYQKSAAQGNALGQCNFGYMFRHGYGVKKNDVRALEWYRKSAKQRNALGLYNLGHMYQYGYGVNQDYDVALRCYRESAEQGNVHGQRSLAYMYQNGYGTTKDYVEARNWYQKAAEQGDASAQRNLGYLYQQDSGVPENEVQAVYWYRKSAEQGDALGQHNLGYMYQHGYGVKESHIKAVEWYRKSATQGNASGQFSLGYMYQHGHGVEMRMEGAVFWYRKAAEQGYSKARDRLALLGLQQ